MKLTNEDRLNITREICKRSLSEFVKRAWRVLEPSQPYTHGWHIDAMSAHLEAVSYGDITRLLINVPPGTMKSLLTSVFWPAWEWGALGRPSTRIIGASHEESLATRDNRKMRLLVTSEWFQKLWPIRLSNALETYVENEHRGFRQSCPVKSMTGKRGDRVIWDDPHSVEAALSEANRQTALRVFQETLPTRLNNPDSSAIVVVMQRLHEEDVSGYILENDLGYVHLCLPMEFEPSRHCSTVIGFTDPRTEEGELLFPKRFPREVVERDKRVMGGHAVAGQFQQRPQPRGGGMFKVEGFKVVDAAPHCVKKVRYWDKAGTQDGGAYTAGVLMGQTQQGQWIVLEVKRKQLSAMAREALIRQTAEMDGRDVKVWIEQEPGSGGKESAEATIRNLAGFSCQAERVTGDKETRAYAYSAQVEACNILLFKAEWCKDFISEHESFPSGKYKDQVDAAAGAFNKLAARAKRAGALF